MLNLLYWMKLTASRVENADFEAPQERMIF